jgi:3-deoxy-manno-octulosonate cytidylyltransferase (CMP-KDO synthetase)
MKAIAVIPARYASTRLPGKALLDIGGRPMIQRVYEQAARAASLSGVWIATDDQRIFDVVRGFGGQVVMTRADHPSGTDRIAEALRGLETDVVVNVQGDEPLLDPREIDAVVAPLVDDPELQMSTAAVAIHDPHDMAEPGNVKVVVDQHGYALYFSRLPIPFDRSGGCPPRLKHLGLYAYRKEFVFRYAALPPTPLEQMERLEQLRVLEHGYRIRVVLTEHDAIGVDTPEDLERVRALVAQGGAASADSPARAG